MKILLTVGHSLLKNGYYTSADGRSYGGVLEYDYCKKLAPYVKKYLEQVGHTVTLVVCPEKQFTKSTEEKTYKLGIENAGDFDLVAELHLNASSSRAAKGAGVYYYSEKGKVYADRVVTKLGQYFENDGAIARSNLYMLSQTKAPAILIETFFCDNESDCKKAATIGADAIGRAIAEGIANKTLTSTKTQQATTSVQTKAKEKCSSTKALTLSFPVISKGCTGAAVSMLQTMIGTPVTGTWNDTDVSAWKAFQKNTGQDQDGICGQNGWTAVAAHLRANTFK